MNDKDKLIKQYGFDSEQASRILSAIEEIETVFSKEISIEDFIEAINKMNTIE